MNLPDPEKHQMISFIKSGFRIIAGFTLAFGSLQGAGLMLVLTLVGLMLVLAEVLGIVEELV